MQERAHRTGAERDVPRERSAASPAAPAPAEAVLALQRAGGNRATAALLQRLHAPSTPVLQRAPHRAEQGSQIRYQGQVWTVQVSAIGNPNITIWRAPNHTQHLVWATADYTILRDDTDLDFDLRENDPGAAAGPVDAYAGLGSFEQSFKIREKFDEAKLQALQMIKDKARPSVNQQSVASLDAIGLDDFHVTRTGPTLVGAGKLNEAAEWQLSWIEGNADNPRRTWTFTIDSDNPLPAKSQEPHVGWTVKAAAGSQAAIGNSFGHVWLDYVPVKRD